jgi:hypothetical protein
LVVVDKNPEPLLAMPVPLPIVHGTQPGAGKFGPYRNDPDTTAVYSKLPGGVPPGGTAGNVASGPADCAMCGTGSRGGTCAIAIGTAKVAKTVNLTTTERDSIMTSPG